MGQKLVILTGVSSSLGKAIADSLLRDTKFVVVATSRRPELEIDWLQQALSDFPSRLHYYKADLSIQQEVFGLRTFVRRLSDSVASIVHAAGGTKNFARFSELAPEDWMRAYEDNVISAVNMVSIFSDDLFSAGESSVLLIGSVAASEPGEMNPHYSTSKAALANLCKYLSRLYGLRGVRVNLLTLGPIDSGMWAEKNGIRAEERIVETVRAAEEQIPLGKIGESGDIASAVAILIQEPFQWMTGAEIKLDGGKSRAI